jgi:hypothetical protein
VYLKCTYDYTISVVVFWNVLPRARLKKLCKYSCIWTTRTEETAVRSFFDYSERRVKRLKRECTRSSLTRRRAVPWCTRCTRFLGLGVYFFNFNPSEFYPLVLSTRWSSSASTRTSINTFEFLLYYCTVVTRIRIPTTSKAYSIYIFSAFFFFSCVVHNKLTRIRVHIHIFSWSRHYDIVFFFFFMYAYILRRFRFFTFHHKVFVQKVGHFSQGKKITTMESKKKKKDFGMHHIYSLTDGHVYVTFADVQKYHARSTDKSSVVSLRWLYTIRRD